MLWFDESDRSLKDRVQDAATYYADKYGQAPTLCVVHPSMMNGEGDEMGELQLHKARSVMPNHFWVGIDEKSNGGGDAARKKSEAKAENAGTTSRKNGAKAKRTAKAVKQGTKTKSKTGGAKTKKAKAKKAA